jgi:uncharacterized protein (TIGR02246 family)
MYQRKTWISTDNFPSKHFHRLYYSFLLMLIPRYYRGKLNVNECFDIEKLSMKIQFILLLAFLGMANLAYAQDSEFSDADEIAIRMLIAQYLETRIQNDEEALRSLLTEDVDQLPTSGNLRSGIDEVAAGVLANTANTGGDRSITIQRIRYIGSSVAIVDGLYDIVNRLDGIDRHYLTSFTVTRETNRWKITAIRNMQPSQ